MANTSTPTVTPTVTYWALSVFNSKTQWVNAAALVVALLSLSEIYVLVSPRWIPLYTATIAALNMVLRMYTVRPVVFAAPGTLTPVPVPRLGPPDPAALDGLM